MQPLAFGTLVELCRPLLLDPGAATAVSAAVDDVARSRGVTRPRIELEIQKLCSELGVEATPAATRPSRLAAEAIRRGLVTIHDVRRRDGDDGDGLVGAFVPCG